MTSYPQLDRFQHPLTGLVRHRLSDRVATLETVRTLTAVIQGLVILGKPTSPNNVLVSLRNPVTLIRQCPAIQNGRVFEARLWLKRVASWDTTTRAKRMEPLIRVFSAPLNVPYGTNRKGLH